MNNEELIQAESEPLRRTTIFSRIAIFMKGADPRQRRSAGNIFKFLALLLALTLIARGTSAATLARVDIGAPSRSTIVEAVTGTATVSARDTLDITAPEGLTIIEILADVGQTVETGDPIAVFDSDEVREKLTRETLSLNRMFFDLDKYDRTETADASSIESARRSLRRAQEDYEITRAQGEADVAAAMDALNEELEAESTDPDVAALQSAVRSLQRAQEDYAGTKAQGEADVETAQAALDEAEAGRPGAVDDSQLQSARRSLERANEDLRTARSQGAADVAAAWDSLYSLEASGASEQQIEQAMSSISSAQRRADDNLLSAERRVEDAVTSLERAEQDFEKAVEQAAEARQNEIDRARDALESARSRAEDNLISASRRLEDAEVAYEKAEQDYNRNMEQSIDSARSAVDRAREALENAQSRARENLQSARRRVEDAEVALAAAERNYISSEQQILDTAAQNSTSAATLMLDIEAQKNVVDALESLLAGGCVLYSNIEGVVSSVASGGSVTSKAPLVSFMDGARGFEALLQISESDSSKLAVGDECEVTTRGGSIYFTPTVTGAVSGISTPDANDRVTVTIRLPGSDWSQGQRVEVQAVQSIGNYDLCVPVSALHSDNSGYYLLVVDKQSTILGLQNVVTRVDIIVAASDGDSASVRGPVDRGSQVIVSSNKAVAAGDRVRING